MTRPLERVRARYAVGLQRRLQGCPSYPRAEVRHLWDCDDVPDEVDWMIPGYYWRTEPGAAWCALGVTIGQARRYVLDIERREGVRQGPPSVAEVLGTVVTIAGALLPLAGDVADTVKRLQGRS